MKLNSYCPDAEGEMNNVIKHIAWSGNIGKVVLASFHHNRQEIEDNLERELQNLTYDLAPAIIL